MRKCILIILCCVVSGLGLYGQEIENASISISNPTVIEDTVMLRVQDGTNYIRLDELHLPAMVYYIADSAFGPLPAAFSNASQELQMTALFAGRDICMQGWGWQIATTADPQTITVLAHEDATLMVLPTMPEPVVCETIRTDEYLSICRGAEWGGVWYDKSGDYEKTETAQNGCDSIVTLHLTVIPPEETQESVTRCGSYTIKGKKYTESGIIRDTTELEDGCLAIRVIDLTIETDCEGYDTVYFCTGYNTPHKEQDGTITRVYEPYTYESPSEWNYMVGVIEEVEATRSKVNLRRAETNLRNHYKDPLTPIETIVWSYRAQGDAAYRTLTVGEGAQWIEKGVVGVRIQFLCGESYSSDFTTDIVAVKEEAKPVKVVENGRVVIIRGGERYTVLGTKL